LSRKDNLKLISQILDVSSIMALGIKVLLILVIACSFGLGIVILPATPQTATAYNCFAVTQECLETRDPLDIIMKMGMMPAIPTG
jgi:hypothetical protein